MAVVFARDLLLLQPALAAERRHLAAFAMGPCDADDNKIRLPADFLEDTDEWCHPDMTGPPELRPSTWPHTTSCPRGVRTLWMSLNETDVGSCPKAWCS
jgi:hypothetical protein